jgi:hypothetical protein
MAFRFGVLSVRSLGADSDRCHAEASYRESPNEGWVPLGPLSWYSESLRRSLRADPAALESILSNPAEGLGTGLANEEMTITRGGTAYLPILYVRHGSQDLYLSGITNPVVVVIGGASDTAPKEVGIRVTVSASKAAPVTRIYRSAARWDGVTISEMKKSWKERLLWGN